MAINIRYGNVTDLGNLAVESGEGQARSRRQALEQQIASDIRRRYTAQDQITADRLQQIAASNRSRTPTAANRVQQVQGPFQRDIAQRAGQQQAPTQRPGDSLGLTEQEQDALNIALRTGNQRMAQSIVEEARQRMGAQGQGGGFVHGGGEGFSIDAEGNVRGARTVTDAAGEQQIQEIPQQEIQQRGGFVGPGRAPQRDQQVDPATQQKQNLVYQFGADLPPQIRNGFLQYAANPNVDAENLMLRLQQAVKQYTEQGLSVSDQAVEDRFRENMRVKEVQARIRNLNQQKRQAQDELDYYRESGNTEKVKEYQEKIIPELQAKIDEAADRIYQEDTTNQLKQFKDLLNAANESMQAGNQTNNPMRGLGGPAPQR